MTSGEASGFRTAGPDTGRFSTEFREVAGGARRAAHARMQVHTEHSQVIGDALDELEHTSTVLYRWWLERDDREALIAYREVVAGSGLLIALLVEHGRGHDQVVAVARQLYLQVFALLRVLHGDSRAPPGVLAAALALLGAPADHGFGVELHAMSGP